MDKRIIVAMAWVCSLVVVFVVAKKTNPDPKVETVQEDTDWKPASKKVVKKDEIRPEASSEPKVDQTKPKIIREVVYQPVDDPKGYSSRDIEQGLPSALASKDVLGRNLEIAKMLASLDETNIEAALKAFEETPRDERNDDYFRLFMYAWGELGGKEAVDYAFFNEDGKKVRWGGTSAMTAWAGKDPEAAKTYLDGIENDQESKRFMQYGLVSGWAGKDLNGAADYVASLDTGRDRYRFIELLSDKYLEQHGPDGAIRWATQTANASDPEYASMVYNRVTAEVARQDPAKAAAWLDQNASSEYFGSRAFAEVADEWAEKDPVAASRWLAGHFDDERVNGQVVSEMTSEWAERDPVAAANWMNQNLSSGKITGDAVGRVASEWADEDPMATIRWVSGLEDTDMLSRGYASAVDQWARDDLNAAGEWLNNQPRDEVHDRALDTYTRRVAREDPMVALGWAAQIQDTERRERRTVETAQILFREDPETIQQWLPTSGLSEQAQQQVTSPPRRDWRGRGGDRFGDRGGRGGR